MGNVTGTRLHLASRRAGPLRSDATTISRSAQPASSTGSGRACPQIRVDFCRGWVTFRPVRPARPRRAGLRAHCRDAYAHDRRCHARARLLGRAQPPRSGQRDPRARDGCGRGGQVRPSRHAHGHGGRRDRPVHAVPALRPGRARVARSRPLRAVGRARLDAALRAALPDRLSGHGPRAAAALSPARLAHRGPSRIRPCARHRDHHRTARPGPRQRGRHGARRAPSARPVRGGSGRPPHLRDRERRRPDGGHQPRGVLVRRPPAPRPPDRALRRQPHLDRRVDGARPVRRRAHAVRGVRLAGQRDRRPRSRRDRGRSGGGRGRGPAEPDRVPHHDRLRRAAQGGHRRDPWLAARRRRGGGGAPGARLALSAVRDPAGAARGLARLRRARRAGARGLGRTPGAPAGGGPGRVRARPGGRRCRPAWTASCAGSSSVSPGSSRPGRRARPARRCSRRSRRPCRSWSAARPT